MRDVWLHVHVPKAGGSTIRQLMNRNFGDGYYNSNSLLETKQYTRDDVSEIIRCHPWLKCFSDHKLSLDLPFDSKHATVRALCYVREPVARFVSRFFFHRNFEEVNCIAQKLSFREFAEMELVEKFAHPQTNSQINFLSGSHEDLPMDVVQSAVESGQTYLFPVERFDDSCVLLEKKFPQHFSDLSYVTVNSSKRNISIEQNDLEFVKPFLAKDEPLVEFAHRQIDRLIDSEFDDKNQFEIALKEFQERCSRRFHNFRPPVEKGQPLPRKDEIANDQSTNRPEHIK